MAIGGIEIWGVLNVTPDSFYDGGAYLDADAAIAAGLRMVAEGADVIDVGAESTRPAGKTYGVGYSAIAADEELTRALPVVRALVAHGVRVSIDTTKAIVADACLGAGAVIVNDVSCAADPALARSAARASAQYVVMHRRGDGEVPPDGDELASVVAEQVAADLRYAVGRVIEAGVARESVWVDPGIGFSKPARHSMVLLGAMAPLLALGHRVLVGASRKSFIASAHRAQAADADHEAAAGAPAERRIGGTVAACLAAVRAGASALRVHDVEVIVQALAVSGAIERAARGAR